MRLKYFLIAKGFGLFQIAPQRTSAKDIFHNDNGVLWIHDANTVKRWIRDYLEESSDDDWETQEIVWQLPNSLNDGVLKTLSWMYKEKIIRTKK